MPPLLAPVLLLLLVCGAAPAVRADDEVLVSAAASLTDVMNAIGAAYTRAHPGTTVRFNFGSSGALLQQIRQGAPVDVFASAASKEMDTLAAAHRIDPATRLDFAGNRLVLIAPPGSPVHGWDALRLPAVKRVAVSDPASVPSGRYAQDTLTHRGLWDVVRGKAVFGENVRQTLAYVTDQDVDAGIVFATDARIAGDRVHVVAVAAPGRDHRPIVYPAAVVAGGPNPAGARQFVRFLTTPTVRAFLARYGFAPPTGRPAVAAARPRRRGGAASARGPY